MATRIVDPRLFIVEAAFVDWLAEGRRRGRDRINLRGPRHVVALRWHLNATAGNPVGGAPDRGIGLPTGPFTVWRRPSFASQALQPIGFSTSYTRLGDVIAELVLFDEPVAMARLPVFSNSGGLVIGLANAPDPASRVTSSQAPAGQVQIEVHGPYLNGLIVPYAMSIGSIEGVPVAEYEGLPDWEPLEIVGLPVDGGSWGGVGDHAAPQGLLPALVDPMDAAVDRIVRGTPPFGWDDEVSPSVLAPPWAAPDPVQLVDEVNQEVVPKLRDVLVLPQMLQAGQAFDVSFDPPSTLDGQQMNANASTATVSPVKLLRLAVATDPFLTLAFGYGTNLGEEAVADVTPYHDGSTLDYMVTAPYANGLDGESAGVELTAYAPRPVAALPPFPPANLTTEPAVFLAPTQRDTDWAASGTVRWDRPPYNAAVRVASYAAARRDPGTAVTEALMEERPSGGHRPIAPGVAAGDQQAHYVHLTDRYLPIPNDPGSRTVHYWVATQSLFGLWSSWRGVPFSTSQQPSTPPPRIVATTFRVTPPPLGTPLASAKVCAGTLTVDLVWDWTDRSPETIMLVGRMYAADDRAEPPPALPVPSGLERSIGASGPAVELDFGGGSTASVSGVPAGTTLVYLNPAGDEVVAAGAAQGGGIRRYRVRFGGFTADFTATPHIGLALWCSGTEHIPPGRTTGLGGPTLVYASDPVAPPVPPEIVPLASLPDAEGRSHARISWHTAPGAAGYIVYTSDELTMRAHYGMGDPPASDTLSDRATALLDAWEASPDRRPFTRLNATPLLGTSLDVVLPKGSTAIHAYVVISASPGQVEGPWPAGDDLRDRVILRAAPRIATPAPPMLDATAADGAVSLRVTTRDGHRVGRVDVYRVRVDDAARQLDTMGPPIATVVASPTTPGWSVEPVSDGAPKTFTGADTPGGSWKRVWYRAVAWADEAWDVGEAFEYQIAERGLIAGRSSPSNAVAVVVPPPGPPDLSNLALSWPGGMWAGDVQIDWSSLAPLDPSPVGAHLLEVTIRAAGGPPAQPLLSYSGQLGATPVSPPPTGDGLWRNSGGPPATFTARVHRSSASVALEAVVRVIDPIGRITHKSLGVPPGPLLPEPDLSDLDVVVTKTGTVLSFTSTAPLDSFNGAFYMLRITAVPVAGGQNPPFPFDLRAARPGRLLPSSRQPGSAQPTPDEAMARSEVTVVSDEVRPGVPFPGNRVVGAPRPLQLEIALRDIPIDNGQPPGPDPLQIRRSRGAGTRRAYAALARVQVSSFALRLTAPDGRAARATQEVTRP